MFRTQLVALAVVAWIGLGVGQARIPAVQPASDGVPVVEPRPGDEYFGLLIGEDETRARPLGDYAQTEIAGFTVLIDPDAEADPGFRRVRAALIYDLEIVGRLLPPAALERVRGTLIALTLTTPARPGWEGASAACLHVSEEWLVASGYDAARAGVVEILHMDKYLLWRAEQPMMLLHELAHAYHLSLEDGYNNAAVADAYIAASRAHLYDEVGYILGGEGQTRPAYAGANPQEYFAELTEAYFGRNDYGPFTRQELAEHDPAGYAMIEAVWGIHSAADRPDPAGTAPRP